MSVTQGRLYVVMGAVLGQRAGYLWSRVLAIDQQRVAVVGRGRKSRPTTSNRRYEVVCSGTLRRK
jgi:hypothetical protein